MTPSERAKLHDILARHTEGAGVDRVKLAAELERFVAELLNRRAAEDLAHRGGRIAGAPLVRGR